MGADDIASVAWKRLCHAFKRHEQLVLRAVLEPEPNPASRLTLSSKKDLFGKNRVRLNWRLSRGDRRSFRRLLETIDEELTSANLGQIVGLPESDEWPTTLTGGSHHMGTTRMHTDPKHGVVDGDCKIHGMSNLFVAGSSVFPTSGYANPTLTIVALALRLADHVKKQFASRV